MGVVCSKANRYRETSAGAEVGAKTNNGNTALLRAAGDGHAEVCKDLLAGGAEVDAKDDYGCAPLLWAARNGHIDMLKLLLDNGADANILDKHSNTPYSLAEKKGEKEVLAILEAAMKGGAKGKGKSAGSKAAPIIKV